MIIVCFLKQIRSIQDNLQPDQWRRKGGQEGAFALGGILQGAPFDFFETGNIGMSPRKSHVLHGVYAQVYFHQYGS